MLSKKVIDDRPVAKVATDPMEHVEQRFRLLEVSSTIVASLKRCFEDILISLFTSDYFW